MLNSREHHDGRGSGRASPDIDGSNPTGSAELYSTPINDDWIRSCDPAGDSHGRGLSEQSSTVTAFRKLASLRRDFRIGGPRPKGCGAIGKRIGPIEEVGLPLYSDIEPECTRTLQKIEVCDNNGLDWEFSKPTTLEDWKGFLHSTWWIAGLLKCL